MGKSPMSGATAESTPSSADATADPFAPPRPTPAGTLVYDGDCGFCTATARWVQRRLSDDCGVISSQQADLDALGLTADDVARSAWWICPDGTRLDEHRSMAGALGSMGGPWPAVGRLLTLGPISPMARWGYRLVAGNRYRIRWPGATRCDRQ